ncbi:MAG: class IV adenylate cyclase [Candidatus Nanohaloarchaea archaeon]|nr:class IV adenylate cyclase [Candidatus Nanohaloarchaea archaeon]
MDEIEAKVLEIDDAAVAERLAEVGAEQVMDAEVESSFYDYPDGSIEKQGVLRLRRIEEYDTFVTMKCDISRDGAKTMEETEFSVSDYEAVDAFFEQLGLQKIRESSKHRRKWEKADVEYVIDEYPGIPPLLEVEAPDEETMYEAFDELGYTKDELVAWDASQVKEHYEG